MPRAAMSGSILHRLRLLLAGVFVVGGIVALIAAWLFSQAAATEAYDRLLVSAATQIADAVGVEEDRFSVLPPDAVFETLAQSVDDRFFFAVRSPAGDLLTGRAALQPIGVPSQTGRPTFGYVTDDGEQMRAVTLYRLIASPRTGGWCSVIVAQSLAGRSRMARRLLVRISAIVLFGAALGYFASLGAVRWALRPFERIRTVLASRRAQDTGPLMVDSPSETQPLVETINAAFQRLDERLDQLQSFVGVTAHQIRTPLAALSAQTELSLVDLGADPRRGRVERIRAHAIKLSRLTNQLLGQATVSYRSERAEHGSVDLAELVRHALRDAIPESLERDLAVDLQAGRSRIVAVADQVMMREALVNLVSNAVVHGAPSILRVRIDEVGGRVRVVVADDGPGMSDELWERAVRPFRLARAQGAGAGLGLAIVAAVVRAHEGKLTIGRTADGLFAITLDLPGAPGNGL